MNIGELFVTLGIKGKGLGTLKDVSKMVANLPVDAAAAIAGMAGISLELGKMAEEAMATSVAFQAFTNQTGLSWQQLQRWQLVAEQANVSAQTVATSVSTLERNLAEIKLGRGNVSPFQMLGINPNQNAFGVIEQLRQRVKTLNPATATNLISQMGLSPDMMNVLRLTDRQFSDFANHVHGISERQQEDFLNAKLSVTRLGEAFRYTMFQVVSDLTEAWQKAAQFKDILKAIGVAAGIAAVYFFPLTAAMAALLLVMDDLAVYFVGGKSLTGIGVAGLKKFFKDLGEFADLSPVEKIERMAHAIEVLVESLAKLYAFKGIGNMASMAAFKDILMGGFITGPTAALAQAVAGNGGGDRSMENNININVHSAGPLDAPGWGEVAHMVKKSVEDAHLQLNN